VRSEFLFNADWLFAPERLPLDAPDSAFEPVMLPHTNKLLPYHNFDNAAYQFISTYRKRFTLPEPREGRRVRVAFEGAMLVSTVYVNGKQVGVNAGGYTPFTFDLTDAINEGGENVLTVYLDSTERPDVPPFGYVVDYLTFGGIYRDVHLCMVEPVHITDVFVKPQNVLNDAPELTFDLTITNTTSKPVTGRWTVGFGLRYSKTQYNAQGDITIPAGGKSTVSEHLTVKHLPRWTLTNPQLCHYTATFAVDHETQDWRRGHFGIRQAEFREDGGFYLNGERVQLRGLNRHQTYPYIGAAAPARLQHHDAEVLKYELGCNIVRTSHYPQSKHFLNHCDEIGLLVLEEIPGWQFIGDEDWQALSLRDVRAMIERDRNHPSVILWGVRVNESWDNDDLYRKTNALAHDLDPTRPTTGIRFFQESTFLEDVFGFNDFSNSVQEPQNVPHLITEYNGHMFPTKTFDNEERKMEHARRHAHIQDLAYGNPRVAGAIGWCAFDYNTHKEFGSGDRICYHGVMDIFRLPKWAAYVYASQQDPAKQVIMHAATHWTMGDRSGGGNDPIYVFGNVEEIDVYYGDEHLGRFTPDRETYPHLPHPPFTVTGLAMTMMWGQAFGTLRVVGYIDGKQVAQQQVSSDGVPHQLELSTTYAELHADGIDMTPLTVRITDEFGNTLPYAQQVVTFRVDCVETEYDITSPPQIIGENPLVLPGGQGGVYLKAGREVGTFVVTASTPHLPDQTVTIKLI
jgi:beta-galactosidase